MMAMPNPLSPLGRVAPRRRWVQAGSRQEGAACGWERAAPGMGISPRRRGAAASCSISLPSSLMEKVVILIVWGVASRISVFRLFIEIHWTVLSCLSFMFFIMLAYEVLS